MPLANDSSVTVSVTCYHAGPYVRRAVESLLAQTHKDLTVVVVNDGDPNPPWAVLGDIADPRLVRFDLQQNHGPYFAHQVVLGASDSPYLFIHDADDWSAPERVSRLLGALAAENADLAFCAWQQYRPGADGTLYKDSIRWTRKKAGGPPAAAHNGNGTLHEPFLFDPMLTADYINRASHHGIFRRSALESLGGYYAGFRINHDTLLTNLILMTGKIAFVEAPLYHYLLRRDSLSHSPASGARSAARIEARAKQQAIYREALAHFREYSAGKQTSEEFLGRVRSLLSRHVTAADRSALQQETERLAELLRSRR